MYSVTQQQSDENVIQNIIHAMTNNPNGEKNVGRLHMTDDSVFIRPTGNPLDMKGWDAMMNSDDVTLKFSKLISINKLEVGQDMAYACYTSHSQFNYKGNDNDDIAVFTAIYKKLDGVWKFVFGQRSTGRNPDDPLPKF
jgi:ketosteroid isomerase-like protein